MNKYLKPYVIAEIGCNHKGDIAIAKEIHIAKIFLQCRCSKISKGITESCLQRNIRCTALLIIPMDIPMVRIRSFGVCAATCWIKTYCESVGLVYSTSVWDATSAKEILHYILNSLKYRQPVIIMKCSSGYVKITMAKFIFLQAWRPRMKRRTWFSFFIDKGRNKDLVLYNCTSGYPVPFEDVCLLDINLLKQNTVGSETHWFLGII
jgi:N-acetylneuraminate synthase